MARLLLFIALVVAIAVVAAAACSPQAAPTPVPSPTATASASPSAARPSPSTAATASPPATPSATGPTGTPPPVACAVQSGGDSGAQVQITAIRTAHQAGFDRVVFEFGPSPVGTYGLPPWRITTTNAFIATSGRQVPVDGNAFLQVVFQNASTVDPATGKQTFTQTDIRPGLPLVREVKLIDDFERVMTWGLGLDRLACAKVTELAGPARLVVDLPTPP